MGRSYQKVEQGTRDVIGFVDTWRKRTGERLSRISARLCTETRAGSAAIEFALIAPIFFVLLMGTLEIGIIFLANFVLQNATNDAARQIRTGQVALSAMSQEDFRQLVCGKIGPMLRCDANLQIDVQNFANFSAVTMTNPVRADGTLDPSLNHWLPGTVCSIVLVRAFYVWPVATPLLTTFLVNMGTSKHLLTAAAAFRNEPFTTAVSGC